MSKNDFCSLLLPSRVRAKLREHGIHDDNDVGAAGPSFRAEADMVMARRRALPTFAFKTASELLQHSRTLEPIPTWIPSIDAALDGGIARRKITEVTGFPGSGKTQFCLQVAASNHFTGNSTVYIDCKGGFTRTRFEQILDGIASKQRSRRREAGVCATPNFCFRPCSSWEELSALLSFLLLLPQQSLAANDDHPITLVIVDGFDFHLRHGVDDLPLRRKIVGCMTRKLVDVATKLDVAVLLTNHLSMKPTSAGSGTLKPAPALGQTFGQDCSYRVTFGFKGHVREATFFKAPSFGHVVVSFEIGPDGIVEALPDL
ncbi:RAD51C protein, putative [Ixodes scapularis]|uniref:DNA repair protein RAD51 homolog 3 n=1 Tax=Ixodes scapularis TaxID=6945 RepID=B7Q095_IXOSC|nr:RAD51C protein, putative [Ixodes scapularis]|eukprot:XP_002407309.1 RAD51C protein, putative [Ixodes scapularis]